ncbi:MAG TPA: alpha-amylase family glycosyl hydrolase [Candidatus Acidoferrales bacterium]|jgi:maltose alpha-D-glucosyltransferase/alpha-amylase|nr:alpha-amylase family glycosyl hydrolase [Candidatus Acidoferrales bacterium]
MSKRPGSGGDPLWYKDAIIHESHVRAFKDSNGDGIRDFPELTQTLDYLRHLVVTRLWLLPSVPSPLKDNPHDISDDMNAHSMHGTMDDFRAFLAAVLERTLQFPLTRATREGDAGWR